MKRTITITRKLSLCTGLLALTAITPQLFGAATMLPLRLENPGTCMFNSSTVQTVESTFGSSLAALPFTGTASYDFYSPPLTTATTLTATDKGGGMIYMRNTAGTIANDFSVAGRMQYFDYDPVSGLQTFIADTTDSPHKDVNHGQTVNWAIPNQTLPAPKIVPAGHLLHVVLTITLLSGEPAGFGSMLYNGPSGSSTVAYLSQSSTTTWSFGAPASGPDATIVPSAYSVTPNSIGHTAAVAAVAGASCVWSITNGVITAGQGTSQITWNAGSIGPVTLGISIQTGCSAVGTANIAIAGIVQPVTPGPMTIDLLPDGRTRVKASGSPGQSYRIEAAADLAAPLWSTLLTTNPGPSGIFELIDGDAPNFPARFYRCVAP
jgi:hypothetical protein